MLSVSVMSDHRFFFVKKSVGAKVALLTRVFVSAKNKLTYLLASITTNRVTS